MFHRSDNKLCLPWVLLSCFRDLIAKLCLLWRVVLPVGRFGSAPLPFAMPHFVLQSNQHMAFAVVCFFSDNWISDIYFSSLQFTLSSSLCQCQSAARGTDKRLHCGSNCHLWSPARNVIVFVSVVLTLSLPCLPHCHLGNNSAKLKIIKASPPYPLSLIHISEPTRRA